MSHVTSLPSSAPPRPASPLAIPSPAQVEAERRSPYRPQFREGWRKHIPGGARETEPAATEHASPISVWMSRVDTLLAAASNLELLDRDDRTSLQKIRSGPTRDSATAARILLRLSLSALTERRTPPQAWRFVRDDFGKPRVQGDSEGLDFSVSHVDAVVMVALGRGVDVGIDVETMDQQIEDTVIEQFCHASERVVLDELLPAQRRRVFLEFWTAKEAYTKMLGLGHSLEFRSLSVLKSDEFEDRAARICVEDFYFSIDHSLYHAALVVDRKVTQRPIEIQLITAALPGKAAFTASPAGF